VKEKYTDLKLNNDKWLIEEFKKENKRQLSKFGIKSVSAYEWMSYLIEEVGELAQAINDYGFGKGNKENIIKEAIQTATLALKIAEMFKFN